jgi:hypothetical protein
MRTLLLPRDPAYSGYAPWLWASGGCCYPAFSSPRSFSFSVALHLIAIGLAIAGRVVRWVADHE